MGDVFGADDAVYQFAIALWSARDFFKLHVLSYVYVLGVMIPI